MLGDQWDGDAPAVASGGGYGVLVVASGGERGAVDVVADRGDAGGQGAAIGGAERQGAGSPVDGGGEGGDLGAQAGRGGVDAEPARVGSAGSSGAAEGVVVLAVIDLPVELIAAGQGHGRRLGGGAAHHGVDGLSALVVPLRRCRGLDLLLPELAGDRGALVAHVGAADGGVEGDGLAVAAVDPVAGGGGVDAAAGMAGVGLGAVGDRQVAGNVGGGVVGDCQGRDLLAAGDQVAVGRVVVLVGGLQFDGLGVVAGGHRVLDQGGGVETAVGDSRAVDGGEGCGGDVGGGGGGLVGPRRVLVERPGALHVVAGAGAPGGGCALFVDQERGVGDVLAGQAVHVQREQCAGAPEAVLWAAAGGVVGAGAPVVVADLRVAAVLVVVVAALPVAGA